MSEMPEHERSIAEEFRIVALQFVEAQALLDAFEDLKTTKLEQMKSALIAESGEMADNKAERLVKSSAAWEEHIMSGLEAKKKAHKLKVQLKWIEIREKHEDRMSWLERTERRMGRSVP